MKKYIVSFLLILCMLTGCESEPVQAPTTISNTTEATTEVQTSEPTTEAPKPVEISVMMIGDMLMHSGVCDSGLASDGTYNYDHLFTNILDDVQQADLSIVNQETILGGTELGISSYPTFNSPQELGDSIAKAGFNVVLHASNHTLDAGLKAVNNTLNFWNTQHPGVAVLGIHEDENDAQDIYVYEKEGFKVAMLNYTYGTNGIPVPSSAPYCVDLLTDEAKIRNDIRKAKTLADMVIVLPHWGNEYVYSPNSDQEFWTEVFLSEGVDVVIGTHSHVLQPVEMLEGKDGHQMVVYYSLGNFVSNQDEIPRMIGGMAKLTLCKDGDTTYIKNYAIEPVVTHKRFGYKEITTYKLSDYTQDLALQNRILADERWCYTKVSTCYCGANIMNYNSHGPANFSLQYCKDFCKSVLGDMYTGN